MTPHSLAPRLDYDCDGSAACTFVPKTITLSTGQTVSTIAALRLGMHASTMPNGTIYSICAFLEGFQGYRPLTFQEVRAMMDELFGQGCNQCGKIETNWLDSGERNYKGVLKVDYRKQGEERRDGHAPKTYLRDLPSKEYAKDIALLANSCISVMSGDNPGKDFEEKKKTTESLAIRCIVGRSGCTLLHLAVKNNLNIRDLLQRAAKGAPESEFANWVNLTDCKGETALHLAMKIGSPAVIKDMIYPAVYSEYFQVSFPVGDTETVARDLARKRVDVVSQRLKETKKAYGDQNDIRKSQTGC
ncbi:hypothetical protein OQA88_2249 [Cercophora sp. LCS_1]